MSRPRVSDKMLGFGVRQMCCQLPPSLDTACDIETHVTVRADSKNDRSSSTMATSTDSSLEASFLFNQLDEYPWDSDEEFQGGLRAILGSVQDPAQLEHLTLRAKCYYYARKSGTKVDFEAYKQWVEIGREAGQPHSSESEKSNGAPAVQASESQQTGTGVIGDAPKPASFAEICELIAEGKPIPGIKDIPDTVLEGQSTTSQAAKRTKPWEKAGGDVEPPSWMK